MAQDPTRGRVVEMGAEHRDRPVRIALAERAPCLPRLFHIGVKMAAPAGLGDLDGVMHEVTRDDGLAGGSRLHARHGDEVLERLVAQLREKPRALEFG